MTLSYIDTSAAMKLLVEEAESAALVDELTAKLPRRLVASWLLHTELHCAAGRHPDTLDLADVAAVLDTVTLIDLTRGDMLAAGSHAPLRSNDALHLATALRLGVDEIYTYDGELSAAAERLGLRVKKPA